MAEMTALTISIRDLFGGTLVIEMSSTKTVADLKREIERAHPQAPPATTQRIVFAGLLLKDSHTLAEALNDVRTWILRSLCLLSARKRVSKI